MKIRRGFVAALIVVVGVALLTLNDWQPKPDVSAVRPPEPRFTAPAKDVVEIQNVTAALAGILPRIPGGGSWGAGSGHESSADNNKTVVIMATTPLGQGAEDVKFSVVRGLSHSVLGETDEDGALEVPKELVRGMGLVPIASKFALRVYEVPLNVGQVFEVPLVRSAFIKGVVRLPDGTAAGPGIKVHGWNSVFDTRGASGIWYSGPADAQATTDAVGEFELNGLESGMTYSLYAGASGLASLEKIHGRANQDTFVEIPVKYIYGALIELAASDGRLLNAVRYQKPITRTSDAIWPHGASVDIKSRVAALAGVPLAAAFAHNPRLILFASDKLHVGSNTSAARYSERPLGYYPVSADVLPGWLAEPIPVYQVSVLCKSKGFGKLSVILPESQATQSGYRSPECTIPEASLYLEAVGAYEGNGVIEIPLRGLFSGRCEVSGIPYGRYLASVRFSVGSFRYPGEGLIGEPIEISGEDVELRIETQSLGSLEVALTRTDGRIYKGPAVFMIGEGEAYLESIPPDADGNGGMAPAFKVGRGTIRFQNAPYVFPFIIPRRYHIFLQTPRMSPDEFVDGLPPSVVVGAGESIKVPVIITSEL